MSLSINPVKPVKVIDPVLNFQEKQHYVVLTGGQRVSWKPIVSTSYTNSSSTFSAPPPSPMVAVPRNVRLLQPVDFVFTGTAPAGQGLLQSGFDAPRAYPLSTNMNTLQLDLNNTSFSINMSDVIQPLLRYHNADNLKEGHMSTTPSTMDKSQQYTDLANSVHNPLGSILDGSIGGIDPRGAFPADSFTNAISTDPLIPIQSTASYTFCEDLFISPLIFGTCKEETGFIGLQTFQLTVNWNNDLSRMWSHDDSSGSVLTNIQVTLGQPTLLFEYKTPSPTSYIPSFRRFPYYEIQRYPTESGALIASGEQTTISSSNIQLNSIPRTMYILCRKRNQDLSFTDTDTFLSIEKISINWANNSGLLSNATKRDLFNMSVKNGCNMNWREWSAEDSRFYSGGDVTRTISGVGSVLAVEFGTDIALNPDEAPGLNGTYQLQMELTVINQSASSILPAIYVIVVNEGVFTLENNSAMSQVGVISRTDVMDAQTQLGIDYNDLKHMAGAGFFKNFGRKLKNTLRAIREKGVPIAREVIKTAKEVAPVIREIIEIAKATGGAMDPDDYIDQYENMHKVRIEGAARTKARKMLGGILLGGQLVGGESSRGMRRALPFR